MAVGEGLYWLSILIQLWWPYPLDDSSLGLRESKHGLIDNSYLRRPHFDSRDSFGTRRFAGHCQSDLLISYLTLSVIPSPLSATLLPLPHIARSMDIALETTGELGSSLEAWFFIRIATVVPAVSVAR